MKLLPYLHSMPRVKRNIKRCLDFVGRQPWGKPYDRELDIYRGIEKVRENPEANHPELRRSDTGIWLRRCKAAQFVIVYTYLPSNDPLLPGVVSIRAVRHSRAEDGISMNFDWPTTYASRVRSSMGRRDCIRKSSDYDPVTRMYVESKPGSFRSFHRRRFLRTLRR